MQTSASRLIAEERLRFVDEFLEQLELEMAPQSGSDQALEHFIAGRLAE